MLMAQSDQMAFAFGASPKRRESIAERFERFHRNNPHVYAALVRLAREAKAVGHRKIGIKMLVEVARWQLSMRTVGEEFKIPNDYTAHYARMIMEREADLDGMFELRKLRSE